MLSLKHLQMLVLLVFNGNDERSYEEIRAQTRIPEDVLVRALEPMSIGKLTRRFLIKSPDTNVFSPSDKYRVNELFAARKKVTKVVMSTRTAEGTKAAPMNLDKHAVEACLMRTMKSAKKMYHDELVAAVEKNLSPRFKPQKDLIEERIASLVKRDFLEHIETVYTYVP